VAKVTVSEQVLFKSDKGTAHVNGFFVPLINITARRLAVIKTPL
jgi:hypothetical protein